MIRRRVVDKPEGLPNASHASRLAVLVVGLGLGAVLAFVTTLALAGSAPATAQEQAPIWLNPSASTLTGKDIAVSGGIATSADLSGAVVKLYRREVGEAVDTLVGEATVAHDFTGNWFRATVPRATRSCVITASWDGNAEYAPTSTWKFHGVRPKLTVTVPRATRRATKVRIEITPAQTYFALGLQKPPFIARVECRRNGVWGRFPAQIGTAGTDGSSWCAYGYYDVRPGTYLIRASFAGTNDNVASFSRSQRITIP